ncbi:lipocalin-like domain-containing protein [Serratia ficaria]|uniref:lipocalin-like domain-containing protein n=1 Tax=Serratia ficaria TaxID=61651 RepID=UPI0021B71354|nr:lipocalin-like domain-containing protein [Serratia ficaria]
MVNSRYEKLIGAWRLIRYVEYPVDDSVPREPMTENPQGLLLYTSDGFMSAQLCAPERTCFTSGDWFVASSEEFRAEATSYIAYSGPWEPGTEAGTIIHGMDVSLFPNWSGQRQVRNFRLEDEYLFLASKEPVHSGGRLIHAELQWKRAVLNN